MTAVSAPADRLARWRDGWVPFVLYPLLALLAFPTLELLAWGRDGLLFAPDLLDIPRSGIFDDWPAAGFSLWNTHVASGNPLLVSQAIGPFAIDVPLGLLVGPFWALVLNGWLLSSVAGISMHLFLRDSLRLSTLAVLGGATLFAFSFWHPIIGFVIPATPLLLWLADGAFRDGPHRTRYAVGHVLVGAFVLYNGQSQIVVLVALLELGFAWSLGHVRRPRPFGGWVAMWAASFGLYAPVLATQLPLLADSQRSSWQLDRGPVGPVLAGAARLYAGVAAGVPLGGGWGSSASIYGTFYLGLAGLPLLVAALLSRPRGAVRFLVLVLLAIPALDILLTLAGPLQAQLGPLRSFQVVRVRHLFVVPLVALAAVGIDALPGLVRTRRGRILVGAALVPLLVTVLPSLAELVIHRKGLRHLSEVGVGWALAAGASALAVAVVLGGLWWLARSGRLRIAAIVPVALVLLLAGERFAYTHAERLLDGQLSTWRASLDSTAAQRYILAQDTSGVDRVLSFGEDANRMGAVGLLQVDGYQTIYPAAYQQLFGALIRPTLDKDPARANYFDHWGNRAIAFGPAVDPELVSLMGARWLYVRNPPRPEFNGGLYVGLPWTPTVPGIVERFRDAGATVYEVPTVLPRAFLAGTVVPGADDAALLSGLASAGLDDLRTHAWVTEADAAGSDLAPLAGAGGADAGAAGISVYTPDRVTIDVHAKAPAVLVLTDTWSPGWVADVDGVPATVHRVDLAYRGIVVPAGDHRVTLRYVPVATYVGFGLALATIVLTGLGALLLARRSRRGAGSAG